MDVYSLRLTDARIIRIRGNRYSVDTDLYPGAASRYRAAFRLVCGDELETNALCCALEVVLSDEEAKSQIYSFAVTADSPELALSALDQFDPCAYLPRGRLQDHDLHEIRTRYDERARRFRDEALQFFSGTSRDDERS